jgi:bifunctional non-homologous end joining protein LigD
MKWDGVRAVVYVEGGRARAMSRNDIDMTAAYPELREMAASLGSRPVVLDGEIVALDARGRPSFERLQPRMHVGNATQIRRLAASTPVTFMAFDVVHLDGRQTTGLPYTERRRLLESLQLQGRSWQTPPAWFGGGPMVLDAAREQGLEGVVVKRLDSLYHPGRRSEDWLKVKHLRTQEVVVGGWKPGAGRREGMVGSLLLGVQGAEGLEYAGKVGTGFSEQALAELGTQLRALERPESPFAGAVPRPDAREAHWVEPVVVGEVRFGEWTRDGRLRHPAWRGLRPDKAPEDVVREDVRDV